MITTATPEYLRERLQSGEHIPDVQERIRDAVCARREERSQHTQWGLLCEEAGLMSLAFSEFQLALRDDRNDSVAAFHLVQHYRERGDSGRAVGLLAQLLEANPAEETWLRQYVELLLEDGAAPRAAEAINRAVSRGLAPDKAQLLRRLVGSHRREISAAPAEANAPLVPTDADCIRFHTLFSGREGVYARQWVRPNGEGGYSPVQEPLTPSVIRNHLMGNYTIGVYVLRLDATATFFALDLDIDKQALQRARGDHAYAQTLRETLRCEGPRLLGVLRDLGFQPLFENSGYKGRHYWVFLEQPETAEALHLLGRLLLAWQSPLLPPGLHLEFFPKQATLKGKGLGNLIKLPLGIHRRTGYYSKLLDERGVPLTDPLPALRAVVPLGKTTLYSAIDHLKQLPSAAAAPISGASSTGDQRAGESAPWEGDDETAVRVDAPPPPARVPVWTEADFDADPRVRHLLAECPVLADLKRIVDEHRRLSHEEQLVLIHSLGHLEGGPQAVNYLFGKCVDVGPEKLMKDRLKGCPVSCPSIRRKVPYITRRVVCKCGFEFAADRYPNPVLHLLTMSAAAPPVSVVASHDLSVLARRFGVLDRRRAEIQREWEHMKESLATAIRTLPERCIVCEGGRYRLVDIEGVEELRFEPDAGQAGG
jgi:hypothetical protein